MAQTISRFVDRTLHTNTGDQIGKIRDVLLRPSNLQPEWLVVKTGWRKGEHLVPVVAVAERGESLIVPYTKDQVDSSPKPAQHVAPRASEAQAAYQHYGLEIPPDDAI